MNTLSGCQVRARPWGTLSSHSKAAALPAWIKAESLTQSKPSALATAFPMETQTPPLAHPGTAQHAQAEQ